MEMYAYEMGDGTADGWAADGEFNGFSLNEYFKAKKVDPRAQSTGPAPTSSRTPTASRVPRDAPRQAAATR